MIKAIIVEDSRLARLELKELLRVHPEIEVLGEAVTISQALELFRLTAPDLIFLDIHLPGGSGFELLEQLDHLPGIIFTTAFSQYALQSYDYNTIDYLLKPIVPERLQKAIQKTLASLKAPHHQSGLPGKPERILIKDQHRTWLVALDDIRYFDSKGNYTQVHFARSSPLMLRSLQQLEDTLDPRRFIRINRQQIVNVGHVQQAAEVSGKRLKLTLTDNTIMDVSRRQVSRFRELFSF
jgi:two-component system LytT family response regulator